MKRSIWFVCAALVVPALAVAQPSNPSQAADAFYKEGETQYNLGNFAFDAPTIDHPFDPANGTWGALELAGRYSTVDLNYHAGKPGFATPADGVRGGKQTIIAAGLNWYPNSVIRFMFDYQHVKVSRLSPNAVTFQTPLGAQIGQHYDTVSVRSQLAF